MSQSEPVAQRNVQGQTSLHWPFIVVSVSVSEDGPERLVEMIKVEESGSRALPLLSESRTFITPPLSIFAAGESDDCVWELQVRLSDEHGEVGRGSYELDVSKAEITLRALSESGECVDLFKR